MAIYKVTKLKTGEQSHEPNLHDEYDSITARMNPEHKPGYYGRDYENFVQELLDSDHFQAACGISVEEVPYVTAIENMVEKKHEAVAEAKMCTEIVTHFTASALAELQFEEEDDAAPHVEKILKASEQAPVHVLKWFEPNKQGKTRVGELKLASTTRKAL